MTPDQSQAEVPKNRIIDVTGLDKYQALQVILPYMAYPDDADERERVAAYDQARIAQKRGALDQLSEETIVRLIEAADKGVGSYLVEAATGGGAAGQVLLAVLAMQEAGVEDAGLDKAFHVVSEIYKGSVYSNGTPLRMGHNSVSKHWKKYGAVAHLWAAQVTLVANAKEQETLNDTAAWMDGYELAAIAGTLQEKAAQCVLPRDGRPLLRDDAWRIQGVARAVWRASDLPEQVHKALDCFTRRRR